MPLARHARIAIPKHSASRASRSRRPESLGLQDPQGYPFIQLSSYPGLLTSKNWCFEIQSLMTSRLCIYIGHIFVILSSDYFFKINFSESPILNNSASRQPKIGEFLKRMFSWSHLSLRCSSQHEGECPARWAEDHGRGHQHLQGFGEGRGEFLFRQEKWRFADSPHAKFAGESIHQEIHMTYPRNEWWIVQLASFSHPKQNSLWTTEFQEMEARELIKELVFLNQKMGNMDSEIQFIHQISVVETQPQSTMMSSKISLLDLFVPGRNFQLAWCRGKLALTCPHPIERLPFLGVEVLRRLKDFLQ